MSEPNDPCTGALQGVRVIDLTHHISGPTCAMLLGDYGADVTKVEPIEGDPIRVMNVASMRGLKATFIAVNRNKRSIAVDLRDEAGRKLVQRMAAAADVLVENFRPGIADRMGLAYESLSALNPRLVYCSINGFGEQGGYRDRRALDIVVQAMSGMMSITGERGGAPLPCGAPVADHMSGHLGFMGVLLALQARERTGRGQKVCASMMSGALASMSLRLQHYWATGAELRPIGSEHEQSVPWGAYQAADGYFVLAVSTQPFWARLCESIGRPDWAEHPDFATNAVRVANREKLQAELRAVFATRPRDYWVALLSEAGVPCGPVNSVADVVKDEHVLASGIIGQLPHPDGGTVPVVGPPVALSDTPGQLRRAPPALGEHTREILEELGVDPSEVRDLVSRGIVAAAS